MCFAIRPWEPNRLGQYHIRPPGFDKREEPKFLTALDDFPMLDERAES